MITGLQPFTIKPSPMSPPVHVWECILTTHRAGASEFAASAPGYSRACASSNSQKCSEYVKSTHSFFYPAVLESIIRHSGYHSLVWKPACMHEIRAKLSTVDSSGGWRSPTATYAPSGLLGGVTGHACSEISCLISHLSITIPRFYTFPKYRLDYFKPCLCWFSLQLPSKWLSTSLFLFLFFVIFSLIFLTVTGKVVTCLLSVCLTSPCQLVNVWPLKAESVVAGMEYDVMLLGMCPASLTEMSSPVLWQTESTADGFCF